MFRAFSSVLKVEMKSRVFDLGLDFVNFESRCSCIIKKKKGAISLYDHLKNTINKN